MILFFRFSIVLNDSAKISFRKMCRSSFIWSQSIFIPSLLPRETCPLLKFTTNLKPQARNVVYKNYIKINSYYKNRFNILCNWNKSRLMNDFNFIRNNCFCNMERLLCCYVSCRSDNLLFHYQQLNKNKFYYPTSGFLKSYSATWPIYSNCNFLSHSYSSKKPSVNNRHLALKRQELIKSVLHEKQKKIKLTQQRIKRSGKLLLDDIKETKSKMKVKMEEIIEVSLCSINIFL